MFYEIRLELKTEITCLSFQRLLKELLNKKMHIKMHNCRGMDSNKHYTSPLKLSKFEEDTQIFAVYIAIEWDEPKLSHLLSKIQHFYIFMIRLEKCQEFWENFEGVITHPIKLVIIFVHHDKDFPEKWKKVERVCKKFSKIETLEILEDDNPIGLVSELFSMILKNNFWGNYESIWNARTISVNFSKYRWFNPSITTIKKDLSLTIKANRNAFNSNQRNSLLESKRNVQETSYFVKDIKLKLNEYRKPLFYYDGVIVADYIDFITFDPRNVSLVDEPNSKLSDAIEASEEELQEEKIGIFLGHKIHSIKSEDMWKFCHFSNEFNKLSNTYTFDFCDWDLTNSKSNYDTTMSQLPPKSLLKIW
jgi:hypothetical protein